MSITGCGEGTVAKTGNHLLPHSVNAYHRTVPWHFIGDENVGCAPAPSRERSAHEASIQTSYIR